MAEWDPIGVHDVPEAADEYDSYIGGIFELLEHRASEDSLAEYLRHIETERMGLVDASGEPLLPERRRSAAVVSLKKLGNYFQ